MSHALPPLWPDPQPLGAAERSALEQRLAGPFAAALTGLGLSPDLAPTLPGVHLPLAAWVRTRRRDSAPLVVGVNGAQGSGKSTLCALLAGVLEMGFGLRVARLSLDDLYLPRAAREALAREVHPLLRTRGVPGTHDVALGLEVLADLRRGASRPLPAFDKARDDRSPEGAWPVFEGPADVVLFEGWCVGARPQAEAELRDPVNALEAEEDPDGIWRRHVNAQLAGPYADLFGALDLLVMLKVPSFEHVYAWRGLQERRLAASAPAGAGVMGPEALRRFIQHYERLTRALLAELPDRADLVLHVGEDHQVGRIQGR